MGFHFLGQDVMGRFLAEEEQELAERIVYQAAQYAFVGRGASRVSPTSGRN